MEWVECGDCGVCVWCGCRVVWCGVGAMWYGCCVNAVWCGYSVVWCGCSGCGVGVLWSVVIVVCVYGVGVGWCGVVWAQCGMGVV